jgi:hypothetical protein
MGIVERLRRLEDRAKYRMPSYDLFARMKRYEAIFEAIEVGSPLDTDDPEVKDCLEYEQYFADMERARDEAES